MQAQGTEEEEAAHRARRQRLADLLARHAAATSSGALLYGVILCNARAMGEFGAVSVVSGHIRGPDQHDAPARRDPLQRIQLRRRVRRRLAAGLLALVTLAAQGAGRVAVARSGHRQARGAGPARSGRSPHEHRGSTRLASASAPSPPSTTSASTCRTGSSSRCSGRRARARPRCCGSSPGLEVADAGADPVRRRGRHRRSTCASASVGFVFQHYALFRHMTVFENIAFGLRVRPRRSGRPSRRDPRHACTSCSSWCSSTGSPTAIPRSSRAASASASRWRARSPSSPGCCCSTSRSARSTPRCARSCGAGCGACTTRSHVTSVFVTHDQEEALEVADRVVVMNGGAIEQVGTPDEVYDQPARPFVYDFLGNVNLFHGRVHQGRVQIGGLEVDAPEHGDAQDSPAVAYVRPHDIEVERGRDGRPVIDVIVRAHPDGGLPRAARPRAHRQRRADRGRGEPGAVSRAEARGRAIRSTCDPAPSASSSTGARARRRVRAARWRPPPAATYWLATPRGRSRALASQLGPTPLRRSPTGSRSAHQRLTRRGVEARLGAS